MSQKVYHELVWQFERTAHLLMLVIEGGPEERPARFFPGEDENRGALVVGVSHDPPLSPLMPSPVGGGAIPAHTY